MNDITIESHEDDSVTLRAGSITAHISGDSWRDANEAAHVLGGIVTATYEAADIRRRLRSMRERLREMEEMLDSADAHMRALADYSDMVRRSTGTALADAEAVKLGWRLL